MKQAKRVYEKRLVNNKEPVVFGKMVGKQN